MTYSFDLSTIRDLRPSRQQDRLPELLRARARWTFARDLAKARLRADEASARLCRAQGSPALTIGNTVHVDPARLDPAAPEAAPVLLHELAHVAQHAGSDPVAATSLELPDIEAEADAAAAAAIAGRRFPVRPRPDLAAVNYPWWFVLGAIAVLGIGATVYGTSRAQTTRREKAQEEARKAAADGELTGDEREVIVKRYIEPRVHETWYGVIPFYGSINQIRQAENMWEAVGGVSFLALDCTLVGGMLMKTFGKTTATTTVRGLTANSVDDLSAVLTKPSPAVTESFKQASKGGGNAAQRTAFKELIDAMGRGELKLLSKEAAEQSVQQGFKGGTAILAGTRGPTHHSMVFLIHNGKVYRLHGGPLVRMFNYGKPQPLTKVAQSESFLKGWNNVSVYGADHLKGLTGSQITDFLAQWQARSSGINRVLNHLTAPGCSSTAGYTLQTLKAPVSLRAADKMLPVLLDRAMLQGPGLHFTLNRSFSHVLARGAHKGLPWLSAKGGQSFAPALESYGFGALREGNSQNLFNGLSVSMRDRDRRIGIVEEHNTGSGIVQSLYVLEPVDGLNLDAAPLNYGDYSLYMPGIFDMPLPKGVTAGQD